MKKISILLLIIFSFGFAFPQIDVNQLFSNHPEVVIKFQIQDRSQLELFTRLVSIDNVFENEVTAYTNREEFEHFLSLNIPFEIVERQVLSPEELNMLDFEEIEKVRNDWNYYPTYQGYLDMMAQFAMDYPQLCRVVEFGASVQGKKLLACVISKNVNTREAEPQVFWTSSMHGDELTGYVLTLRFIDYLLTNYGTNARITHLLDNMEIWVNPLANPDGTFNGGNNSVSGAIRENINGKDLNRNYPDDTNNGNPGVGPVQNETTAFIALQQAQTFTLAVNLHGGVEVANYPWDNKTSQTADHNWWKYVCREYVDTVQFYKPTYMKGTGVGGNQNGIVWGWQWYQVNGGRQDYANYYNHTREFCLEISSSKTPAASQLPNYWDGHYRSFLNYTQQALYGIQGVVTDACTGEPLPAKISLPTDIHNSFVRTDPRVGFYARYLQPGTYTLTFESEGYQSKTIPGVSAQNYNTTILNVTLQSIQEPIPYVESQIVNFETETTMGDTTITLMNKGNGALNFTATIENAGNISWLSLSNNSGTLCKNEKNDIVISYNFTSLPSALYEANVQIEVAGNVINIPVSILFMGAEDEIGIPYITPESIDIETQEITGECVITMKNIGNKAFDYYLDLEPEYADWWLSLSHHLGTLEVAEQTEIVLSYNFTPITKGREIYGAELYISVNDSVILIPIKINYLPNSVKTQELEDIQVYPNPTTGELTIENGQLTIDNGQLTIQSVVIYDVVGKKQFSIVNCPLSIKKMDISHLFSGIYFLKIETDGGIVVKKVIKN